MSLVLRVADYAGPRRWRWLLTAEGTGRPLADHEVDLSGSGGELAAFAGLHEYLRWNAVPDRRTASEAEIVARAGAWVGRQVLGEAVGRAITDAAPVTVRVVIPPEAGFLLGWPLELAHAGGKPLAARGDVTLEYDLQAPSAGRNAGGGTARAGLGAGPVRMLAVFSLPTQTSVLALRRERYELARLIRRIGARERRQVQLTFLQYGVTRRRLAEVVDSGAGWDVLHLSGHGGAGTFLLETGEGSPDRVDTGELIAMLAPLRRQVRLAVVSACESAAATTAETLRWIGLAEQAEQLEQDAAPEIASSGPGQQADQQEALTGIARALVAELGCAVVAMRYPVTDEFATAFTEDLYDRLLGRGQRLGTALARAVPKAAGPQPSPARPAICMATPVLIGAGAAGLTLPAPAGEPVLDPARQRMAFFPAEPERFVGRAEPMARASAILAPASGRAGVLLHGMAGSGKTACALELAYRHQDSFAAVAFWQAPEQDDDFGAALASLAIALEIQLGDYGFTMADKITTIASLEAFLPRLKALLESSGILLILDNLETLLTPGGTWRDPRWVPLIAALTGHQGESRVILTTRTPPASVADSLLVLPVHALSLDESVALARELPGLRALLHADASPLRDSDEAAIARDRDLVRRVLHVVQGHPKLMRLADAAASAGPPELESQLAAAEAAAGGQALDAFFRHGATSLTATQLLATLTTWTTTILAALPEPAQLMAQFLAFLEDNDRRSYVVDSNWADLWRRLSRAGDPPDPKPLLNSLAAAALIQPDQSPQREDGNEPFVNYRMHPGVTHAIRATASADIQAATDTELAAYWATVAYHAERREGGEAGQTITYAGLSAAPYMLRLQEWDSAGTLLERVIGRDNSPGTIQATLAPLRAIARATRAPDDLSILAKALRSVDPTESEQLMRDTLAQTLADGNFHLASSTAGDLVNMLRVTGRLREALELAEKKADYTRRAELGPWNLLADQTRRLQILGLMGGHQRVHREIRSLLAQMEELPDKQSDNETVTPWNVRETTLDVAHTSALALRDWQQCLDLNAAVLAQMQIRGASAHAIACTRYNDYGPLLWLGRLGEAERLLADCQQVFEDHGDLGQLGQVLAARANLEIARGNPDGALAFQRTAIRYSYARPEPRIIAQCHGNLAAYLKRAGSMTWRTHLLAAALIFQLSDMNHDLGIALTALARDLAQDTGEVLLPGTLDEVIRVAEQTEGVHLGQLITALQPDSQAAAAALAEILDTAANMPAE